MALLLYFSSAIYGENLLLNVEANPRYSFFCGKMWLIVRVTNLRTPDVDIDPEMSNNVFARQYLMLCPDGKTCSRTKLHVVCYCS